MHERPSNSIETLQITLSEMQRRYAEVLELLHRLSTRGSSAQDSGAELLQIQGLIAETAGLQKRVAASLELQSSAGDALPAPVKEQLARVHQMLYRLTARVRETQVQVEGTRQGLSDLLDVSIRVRRMRRAYVRSRGR